MPSTIQGPPIMMLGRFIGLLSVAGVARNTAGLFTPDTTVVADLHAGVNLGGFSYKPSYELENQAPVDLFLENNVPVSSGFEVSVTEIRLASGMPITEAIVFGGFQYFRVQRNYLPPGATTPLIFAAILAISDFDGGDIERGNHKCVLTGKAAGIGAYSASGSSTLAF